MSSQLQCVGLKMVALIMLALSFWPFSALREYRECNSWTPGNPPIILVLMICFQVINLTQKLQTCCALNFQLLEKWKIEVIMMLFSNLARYKNFILVSLEAWCTGLIVLVQFCFIPSAPSRQLWLLLWIDRCHMQDLLTHTDRLLAYNPRSPPMDL